MYNGQILEVQKEHRLAGWWSLVCEAHPPTLRWQLSVSEREQLSKWNYRKFQKRRPIIPRFTLCAVFVNMISVVLLRSLWPGLLTVTPQLRFFECIPTAEMSFPITMHYWCTVTTWHLDRLNHLRWAMSEIVNVTVNLFPKEDTAFAEYNYRVQHCVYYRQERYMNHTTNDTKSVTKLQSLLMLIASMTLNLST